MKIVAVLLGKKKKRGSSTVFLSLIFSVILMLVIAVIALLTYRSEKVNIKRTLDISVESVFGKYYEPLLSDYGLFYYIETDMEAISADVMYYFLENQKDVPKLLKLTPESLVITEKNYLISNRSNIKKQMYEAVVNAYGENLISEFFDMYKTFSDTSVHTDAALDEVIDDVETLEKDAQTEKEILDLIALVEGVRLFGDGIEVEKCFAKKGIPGNITQKKAGIDSPAIWNSLKDEYVDITEILYDLSNGKKVSQNRLKEWKSLINDIKAVTEKAYILAAELDDKMTDVQKKSSVFDVAKITNFLSDNLIILKSLTELNEQDMNDAVYISQIIETFSGYHVTDMYIDYSTYVHGDVKNPTEKIDIDPKGITSFLIGDKKVSGLAIPEADIYQDMELSEEERDVYIDYREPEELPVVIDKFRCEDITGEIKDLAVTGAYMKEFFGHYMSEQIDSEEKRALEYELEYICSGKTSDADNLRSVINKCLLIRTGQSLVYLLSDSSSKQKAYATAAALVGFSGMDALVRITQYMILTGWAYADACVDVAALLDGGKISVIKNKKTLNVKYSELMSFGKEMIQKKAKEANVKSGIDYETIVILFGVLKGDAAVSRCMDVIQYNMKLRDSHRFSFKDAVYGITAEISCIYPYSMKASSTYSY